jgi:hypothetical protein
MNPGCRRRYPRQIAVFASSATRLGLWILPVDVRGSPPAARVRIGDRDESTGAFAKRAVAQFVDTVSDRFQVDTEIPFAAEPVGYGFG